MNVSELKTLLISAAKKYVSPEEAQYFADETVETDLRKAPGVQNNKEVINDLKTRQKGLGPVEKKIDFPGFTQFNFNGLSPSLKIKEIHDELEKKAKANGIAMISIVNSGGMHAMHFWTQGLAKRGLFALGAWNGGPDAVVPFNGTKGIMGTNPMTYGFPSDKGEVVIDMATSEIPYFKIVRAKKNQTPLPPNAAVNDEGELTTDASQAFDDKEVSNLLPMGGGYKGYIINYLIEIMTSALVGARASSEMSPAYIETEHGGFIIAIAIDKVTDPKTYQTTIKSMNEKIRAQKPKKGVEKVIVPGDSNRELINGINDQSEIEVDDGYKSALLGL